MSKDSYKFESNMGTVEVYATADYEDGCRDIEVRIPHEAECVFREVDGAAAEEIVEWMQEIGVEFESDKIEWFVTRYIWSVMLDQDTTESELLLKFADKFPE